MRRLSHSGSSSIETEGCSLIEPASVKCTQSPDAATTLVCAPELSAFARSFAQRASRLAWFLGAGASAQSFIPTADQLVDVLLRQINCTERGISIDSIDLGDHHERRRLQQAFSAQQGFPHYDDPHFYSEVFERAYASSEDRAAFVENLVREAVPNYGHYVLAALVAAKALKLIITSNFDPLIERAINPVLDGEFFDGRQLEIADLDNPGRAARAVNSDRWPLVVKVHGDYRSEHLKNVSSELREQDSELRRAMTSALSRFGVVVVGYSGRDESIMSMLRDVLELPTPFPAGLFWVRRPQDELAESVTRLLSDARSVGVQASIVTASSFVEFATRLEHAVEMPAPVRQWLSARAPSAVRRAEPTPVGPTGKAPILRLNALPVEQLPSKARRIDWAASGITLERLQQEIRGSGYEALVGMVNGNLAALGRDSTIQSRLAHLGIRVTGACRSFDLSVDDTGERDTQALGLVMDALVVGLARERGLGPVLRRRRSHQLRVVRPDDSRLAELRRACRGQLRGEIQDRVSGLRLPWAEAVSVNLERRRGQWWLLLNPDIWTPKMPLPRMSVASPAPDELDTLFSQRAEFIRARHAGRYNRQIGEILTAWIKLLTGNRRIEIRTFDLRVGEGIGAVYVLDGSAASSLPLHGRRGL